MTNDSILTTIKKRLGVVEEYTEFDPDIIMDINSVFSILFQLGVGPDEGFAIEDDTAVWSDYLPEGHLLNDVKTYVYLKTRKMFDPSLNSAVQQSMDNLIAELEWRINVAVDPKEGD